MRFLLLLAFGVLLRTAAFAQSGDVHASLRAPVTQLKVGDEGEVFLEATHDPSRSTIAWPQVPDSFGKLEIHDKGRIDTLRSGNQETLRQRLLVAGFDSGVYTIPPFTFEVNKGAAQITTAPLSLLIQTLPVDTTKPIKPIKDIIPVERRWTDSWILLVAGALLILVIILITLFLVLRKKPQPAIAAPPAPTVPAHIAALDALKKLEAAALWQKGEIKEYYVQLTGIIRTYIEGAYGTPALESTTDELLATIRNHPVLNLGYPSLYNILPMADLAKFAKAAPTAAEQVEAMQGAIAFVNITTPRPPAEPSEEGGSTT